MNWKPYLKILICTIFLAAAFQLHAQEDRALSNLHWKQVSLSGNWQQLDSLPVFPGSISLHEQFEGAEIKIPFELQQGAIRFRESEITAQGDSIWVQFRSLPAIWEAPISRIDSQDITVGIETPMLVYDPFGTPDDPLLDFQGLNYRGNFTRGLAFGNNQSLVLNSSFNLQMAGYIGDGIEVSAAISDENIPIQPEGTTQQLNEFDRVYIQLRKDSTSLIAGDYDLLRPEGYFMNHYKRLQGLSIQSTGLEPGTGTLSLRGNVAISRGKFNRMQFAGQEGNQGPYRLNGRDGETFIIVLAGTEKVFIDGQLMERGLDRDYVINYNSGEITFMNRRLITKDLRIIIEFEYSDQNYLRWLYAAGADYQLEKTRFYLNAYSEQDSRSTVGDGALSEAEKEALRLAGDDPFSAVSSGIDSLLENSANPITYQLRDTLVNGTPYAGILIYQPDTTADLQLYTARFSDLGEGNGNYIRPATNANGVVFVWVAPDEAGNPQGRYEPVIRLVAPRQQQLFTAGFDHQFSKKSQFKGEVALSRNDLNRFSEQDRGDNIGMATYLGFERRFQLGQKWKLNSKVEHEAIHQNFSPLNPYRSPEFNRDWNLDQAQSAPEHWARAEFNLRRDSLNGQLNYRYNGFWKGQLYQGQRHIGNWKIQERGWLLDMTGDLLQSTGQAENSEYWRPQAQLERSFKALDDWKLGAVYQAERNTRTDAETDSLLASAFAFSVYRAYLESPEKEKFGSTLSIQYRTDEQGKGTGFQAFSRAIDSRIDGNWKPGKALRLGWQLHYRRLYLTDPPEGQAGRGDTYTGRTELGLNLLKDALRYSADYQLGSGQEQKVQFIYRAVNPGEGIYQHIDFNGDGIEQNDEFVIAPNQDQATHIRVIVYTNEFIRTNNVQLFQSLVINPRKPWFNETGIKGFLGRFSSQTNWQNNQKVRQLPGVSGWNPFQLALADTALVSSLSNLQQIVYFNQLDPVYGLQYNFTDNQNKTLLTTGFQGRRLVEHLFQLRLNLGKSNALQLRYAQGIKVNQQAGEVMQDYEIAFRRIAPEWSFLPSNDFRTILSYRYEQGADQLSGSDASALFHEGKLEVRYNQASTTFISGSFAFTRVNFTGVQDSAVGFALLEGLQNGNNFQWEVSIDRQLARNLRLSLSYEGRKTG
ncbi:MAG: hypothetical protein KDC34_20375, partial [Saprospiraceae bacterium]|nr:hypothetical protein [Saprospiraceae bacterium]